MRRYTKAIKTSIFFSLMMAFLFVPFFFKSPSLKAELEQSIEREKRLHEIIADRDKAIDEREQLIYAYQTDGNQLHIVNYNPCIICHGGCVVR